MSDLIRVTGLWENKKANGETYLSGTMGGVRVVIFKNSFKDSDRSPSHGLYFSSKERQDVGESQ